MSVQASDAARQSFDLGFIRASSMPANVTMREAMHIADRFDGVSEGKGRAAGSGCAL
jgi:hypothetical protein